MAKSATIQIDDNFPLNAETNEFCRQVIDWITFLNHNFASDVRLSAKFSVSQPQKFVTASIFLNGESLLCLVSDKKGAITNPATGRLVDSIPLSGESWTRIFKPALMRAFHDKKDKLDQLIQHTTGLNMGLLE